MFLIGKIQGLITRHLRYGVHRSSSQPFHFEVNDWKDLSVSPQSWQDRGVFRHNPCHTVGKAGKNVWSWGRTSMRHPKTRALYDYWNALRDGRLAPGRNEVDPREIAPLLDSTFILEVQNADNIRFRLAGTRLCEAFGMELRGMSALALWHGEDRAKVRDLILRVVSGPTIGHVACTVENRGGFVYGAEFLYMPLRSDREELTRILGCGYYMGEERAFANVYDPIHHWVDAVNLYPIDSDEAAEDLPAQRLFTRPGGAPVASSLAPPRAEFGRLERDPFQNARPFKALRGTPALTAIEGGRQPGGLKPFRPKGEEAQMGERRALRDRGHLRLVKSDAM